MNGDLWVTSKGFPKDKNRFQHVLKGLKLYWKIVQKLQIGGGGGTSTPLSDWIVHFPFNCSILTSFCFLMFVREQETLWEHCCSLSHKAHCRAFSYSSWIWGRDTRSQVFIVLFNQFKWLCKGATCLTLSLQMKVKQKGLKWLVQEHLQVINRARNRTHGTGVLI